MKKLLLVVTLILAVCVVAAVVHQFLVVRKAHSSFANYYSFRGCVSLVKKTDTYALCKIASGKVIKMVAVSGKWYLDGDLPICYFGKCW